MWTLVGPHTFRSSTSCKHHPRHDHCHLKQQQHQDLGVKFDTFYLSGQVSTSTLPPHHEQPRCSPYKSHHSHHRHPKRSILIAVVLFLVCSTVLGDDHVCTKSIKIKNKAKYFADLENCTVIEGSLEVVLIDDAKVDDFQNLTFPKLKEVTDFVLFYRATGITSIGKLFPNLTVIRGRNLFLNHALVIYDMKQLIEIGLNNLTVIERGNVKIEKNPHLCFADTINWDIIANKGGQHSIKNNKNINECPSCPEDTCVIGNPTTGKRSTPLCWNQDNCQRVCDLKCKNGCVTGNSSQCCHDECLGGCSKTGKNSTDCVACKHISHRGNCYPRCKDIVGEEARFEFMGRRCITFDECIRSVENNKIHNGKCVPECPVKDGYQNDPKDHHRCALCPKGKCPKVCKGGKIESVSQAQVFKGCTSIDGSLEITVKGNENIVAELESGLENVETITGYLKITRSYPLTTLHFLKNLKRIEGQGDLDRNDYSLVVMDNPNLQELFLWKKSRKLIIERGKVFFHMNPLLCKKEIEKLLKHNEVAEITALTDIGNFDPYDVSPSSNGDKTACDTKNLDLKVVMVTDKVAMINWLNYRKDLDDPRELLGYLIHYRKAEGNVSMFDGRDACTNSEWFILEFEPGEDSKSKPNQTDLVRTEIPRETTIVPGLEPATRYAIFVKTYTIASASKGGLSDIMYFITNPFKPQQPSDVIVTAQSLGSITIKWRPPKKPNGKIVKYIIKGIQDLTNIEAYRNVDHCSDKPINVHKVIQSPTVSSSSTNETTRKDTSDSFIQQILPKNQTVDGINCCACPKISSNAADEADDLIAFEDALHNRVYVKHTQDLAQGTDEGVLGRRKRSVAVDNIYQGITDMPVSSTDTSANDSHVSKAVADEFEVEVNATDGDNTYIVSNLKHFAQYSVKVIACQERDNETMLQYLDKKCSMPAENTIITQPKKHADDIKSVTVSGITNGSQHIVVSSWDEPDEPNGMIVTYHVEYYRDPSGSKTTRCVKRSDFIAQGKSYSLPHDLQAGKYFLRVKARSLASDGNWSEPLVFEVPDLGSLGIWTIVWIALAAGLFVMAFAASSTWFIFRKFHDDPPPNLHYVSMNPEYMPAYEPDEWEIQREKTKLIRELGQGSFGMVYQGELYDYDGKEIMPCAIKTVNDRASALDKIEFLQEASTMKSFTNHHVVKLLGVVSTGNPVFVCMELMEKGDLKNYLRDCRDDVVPNGGDKKQGNGPKFEKPSIKQVHLMATQIADGMAYLAAKKFVHRDLAGRNCMVADDLTVKIGDFGMTRDIYETDYYRKGGKGLLPVRWMAPESLKDGVFTSQSDVWSYGVVLWEIVTLAQQPYQGLSNEQVLKFVLRGETQDKPEKCPEHLFTIMKLCWNWSPKDRPTFIELIEMLYPDVEKSAAETFQKVSHYHNHVPTPVESVADQESCPLTSDFNAEQEDGSGDTTVKFFPSIVGAKSDEEKIQIDENDDNSNPTGNGISTTRTNGIVKNSENNKSSEGSRESKVSNGSVANGHAYRGAAKC